MKFKYRVEQSIWRKIYPIFPKIQKFLLKLRIISHIKERQRYHIGWLSPGVTLEDLKNHLHAKWGFGNHFVAWDDTDQVLSWRRLKSFEYQYHLRVYKDGEIRGHIEYTPEAHPLKHFNEVGEKDGTEDFLKYLGPYATQKKYISHLNLDPHAKDPDSEVVFSEA